MAGTDGPRNAPDWLSDARAHIWLPYTQMQTALAPWPAVRTYGHIIELADGRQLIDGIASWWTAVHGYNHPHIAEALKAQIDRMPHVMLGGLVHEPGARLAARLAAMLPGHLNHVFFADSGSVAVEVALKMAIQFFINRGEGERRRIVAFEDAYHGDTFATMALADPKEGMHRLFAGTFQPQITAPLPRDAAGEQALRDIVERQSGEIAAMIVEPLVQGAGGMRMHSPETLRRIRAVCDDYGIVMIADEIFTGFGRTGSLFAVEQAGIVPDIITLGKALTGGALSLAATVASDGIYDAFLSDDAGAALMHGPTFMGNPLACAAANASLDLFEREPRLSEAMAMEARLRERLAPAREMAGVADVRTLGAIGVIQLETPGGFDWLKAHFVDAGAWIRPFGDIVYVTPALTMPADALDRLTEILLEGVAAWSGRNR
jgi:adenosylmethionine-8-amino-7-oxononanoate aminotransferase